MSQSAAAHTTGSVVTDLTIGIDPLTVPPSSFEAGSHIWYRIEKELYLYTSQQSVWLYVSLANVDELAAEDLVVTDIKIGELLPNHGSGNSWESRPGGIWVQRSGFSGEIDRTATEVDILFGVDAVDPRPQWALMRLPLQLQPDDQSDAPVARLSVLHGRAKPKSEACAALRVKEHGRFKIVQISDTHMVVGVGLCRDAIGAQGESLPECKADPLTVDFIGRILDAEKPDLVILTGDQLHHDVPDTQSALFKVVAPIIQRSIPFAAVFGNHDSEGTAQMSILQNLPLSLCEPGPEQVDGIGNFYLQVLAPAPSQLPLATMYFLDSHGQIPSETHGPDYDPIKQSQIDWFTDISKLQPSTHDKDNNDDRYHLSLAFMHIPLPEFGDHNLIIRSGHRREPSESPSSNSHFYDALAKAGVSALGCGHDHVNDFCGLLPQQQQRDGTIASQHRLWLCYGGVSGFGGYCSYGGLRFHRRSRVWEIDSSTGGLKTWKRVEYCTDRVDELVLVAGGALVDPLKEELKTEATELGQPVTLR